MNKPDTLIIITLVVALIAMGFAVYALSAINSINKKVARADAVTSQMEPMITRIGPLLPHIEDIKALLPQMKQLLLGIPTGGQ